MSAPRGSLHPALHRSLLRMQDLPPGSVVLDRFGDAWQSARGYGPLGSTYASGYWYRAYSDDSEVSTWAAAQYGPMTVIHEAEVRP